MHRIGLCLLASIVAATPAAAQFGGFTWTLTGNPDGSGFQTPTVLHVVGPDTGPCQPNVTYYQTVLPIGGSFTALVHFTNKDNGGPAYDAPAAVIDGVVLKPPVVTPGSTVGWPSGAYVLQFDADAGAHVGLGTWSADCTEGPGTASFYELDVQAKPWSVHHEALDPRVLWTHAMPVFGNSKIAAIGDLDGDGVADIGVCGAESGDPHDVRALSGRDGHQILSVKSFDNEAKSISGLGDIDGDGHADIAVGNPSVSQAGTLLVGAIDVLSGADGALLLRVTGDQFQEMLGERLAGLGDIDLDGVPDLAARTTVPSGIVGGVKLISGATGAVLHSIDDPTIASFAKGLSGAGDLTGDGVPDVLVGSPYNGVPAAAYSGATGQKALVFHSQGLAAFGQSLAPAGDVDGDGWIDVAIGAPGLVPADIGAVAVYSGKNALPLLTVHGQQPGDLLGTSVAGGADVDGDGQPDIVAGAPGAGTGGVVRVFDALSGTAHPDLATNETKAQLGLIVTEPGDLDGDGLPDAVAFANPSDTVSEPSVHAWSHLDAPGAPTLAGSGDLVVGDPVTITIGNTHPFGTGLLVVGTALLDAPVAGGTLGPVPALLVPVVTDASGQAQFAAPWPSGLPTWTTIWMQAWVHDPDGPKGYTASDSIAASQI